MSHSPLTEKTDLISFEILSEGRPIPETYEVMSIRADQHTNRVAFAEIVIKDGYSPEQHFSIATSKTFDPGNEIQIKLGYHGSNKLIFQGVVVQQKIRIESGEGATLTIECKDKCAKMTLNRSNSIFTNNTDSEIIKKIVENHGFQASVHATTKQHKEMVQYYASDWDFCVTRADINGMICYTEKGTFMVAKPDVSGAPKLSVTYGNDIIEFDVALDATTQYNKTEGECWDASTQEVTKSASSEPSVNSQGTSSGKELSKALSTKTHTLLGSSNLAEEDMKIWANAALLKSRLSRFKGTIKFQGSSLATINSVIEIKGVSKRFNGNGYISGVSHIVENGTWISEVSLGLSNSWFSEDFPVTAPDSSGLLPGMKGLHTGVVKKIYEDPENQFRVAVEIPILGSENETVWARLATFYASEGIGAFFMPEINDEVILGFMNEDARFPIILGSVYSSKRAAPETPDEKNTIKALVTKSKLQLKFDDEKKVISIITPEGNTMVFSEEEKSIVITDQNSNKVALSESGIAMSSPKSISIKASEDITIEGMNVNIKANSALNQKGATVSVEGEMSTEIKGGGECAISSDGNLTAKGLMVLIN